MADNPNTIIIRKMIFIIFLRRDQQLDIFQFETY